MAPHLERRVEVFGPVALPPPPSSSGGACVGGAPAEIGLEALTLPTSQQLMAVGAFTTHEIGDQNLCAVEESKAEDEANVKDTAYPGKEDGLDSLSFMSWAKAALMTFSEDMLIRRSQSQSLCSDVGEKPKSEKLSKPMAQRFSPPSSGANNVCCTVLITRSRGTLLGGLHDDSQSEVFYYAIFISSKTGLGVLVASSLELESLIEFPARPTLRSLELPSKSQKPVSFFNSFRTFRPVRAPFPPYAPPAQAYHASRLRRFRQTVFASSAILPAGCMGGVCLCARFQEAPKSFHLEAVKRIFRYIKGTTHLGLWYPKGTVIEIIVYADSDHAGDYVDRKSTSGICTFVGCCLTSWFSKKQTALAISTTEAEYVSAGKACQQALWMKQALIDYDVRLDDVPIIELRLNRKQQAASTTPKAVSSATKAKRAAIAYSVFQLYRTRRGPYLL
ncbi:hypothetical protein Tco_0994332 [Tanacetum coccineum]